MSSAWLPPEAAAVRLSNPDGLSRFGSRRAGEDPCMDTTKAKGETGRMRPRGAHGDTDLPHKASGPAPADPAVSRESAKAKGQRAAHKRTRKEKTS